MIRIRQSERKLNNFPQKVISLSEPDIFTHLALMKDEGKLSGPMLENLARASIRHLCRHLRSDQVCFIKTQDIGGRILY